MLFWYGTCKIKISTPKTKKINTLPGVRNKPAKIKKMHRNREKWLDNWTFRVYTALVSHNGLMRLKEECAGVG